MTDLTRERIEEIKKWKSLFDRGEVVNFLSVGETHDLALQLLATMTALAEAQAAQAVAVAAERDRCAKAGGDKAVEILLRHDPEPGPLKIQMTRQAIAAAIRSEATK